MQSIHAACASALSTQVFEEREDLEQQLKDMQQRSMSQQLEARKLGKWSASVSEEANFLNAVLFDDDDDDMGEEEEHDVDFLAVLDAHVPDSREDENSQEGLIPQMQDVCKERLPEELEAVAQRNAIVVDETPRSEIEEEEAVAVTRRSKSDAAMRWHACRPCALIHVVRHICLQLGTDFVAMVRRQACSDTGSA